jgi:hypothetical protein
VVPVTTALILIKILPWFSQSHTQNYSCFVYILEKRWNNGFFAYFAYEGAVGT